jgi:hypothetical protein
MSNSIKVYELHPLPNGRFSNRTADYAGITVAVAAPSSEQAHALAAAGSWAAGPDNPVGILWEYRRGQKPDHHLFNGERVYGNPVGHGAGKSAIVAWMQDVLD